MSAMPKQDFMTGNPRRLAFRRELLPDAASYFASCGLRLAGRGHWRSALCPFHRDTVPSLRIHVETGSFRCMACGARGGDVLAFHMRLTGLSFPAAVTDLGAWEDDHGRG